MSRLGSLLTCLFIDIRISSQGAVVQVVGRAAYDHSLVRACDSPLSHHPETRRAGVSRPGVARWMVRGSAMRSEPDSPKDAPCQAAALRRVQASRPHHT